MKITRNQGILLCIIVLIIIIAVTCLSTQFNWFILISAILALIVMILNFYIERKK